MQKTYSLGVFLVAAGLTACGQLSITRLTASNPPNGPAPTTGPSTNTPPDQSVSAMKLVRKMMVSGIQFPPNIPDPLLVPQGFPMTLTATGLFKDVKSLVPASGIVEYGVNVPFWSDGASKRRWIALPGYSQISFDPTNAWTFPVGTVLIKHFELPTGANTMQRVETRVLIQSLSGWVGMTYRWRADGSEADLIAPTGASSTYQVYNGTTTQAQTWNFPARTDCMKCHNSAQGYVLGLRTAQINGDFNGANQLSTWQTAGMFEYSIGDASTQEAYPSLSDTTVSPETRARGYLATNCAICHLPGGSAANVGMDLRFETPLAQQGIVNVPALYGNYGLTSPMRIAPGAPDQSMILQRMQSRFVAGQLGQMPPLGSNVVDAGGVELLREWIAGMQQLAPPTTDPTAGLGLGGSSAAVTSSAALLPRAKIRAQ